MQSGRYWDLEDVALWRPVRARGVTAWSAFNTRMSVRFPFTASGDIPHLPFHPTRPVCICLPYLLLSVHQYVRQGVNIAAGATTMVVEREAGIAGFWGGKG